MNEPLVSIVVPTYKRPTYLERALKSIFAQTYTHWELIVVDDNDEKSSYRQETELFMAPYLTRANIKYLKHKCNRVAPPPAIRVSSELWESTLLFWMMMMNGCPTS